MHGFFPRKDGFQLPFLKSNKRKDREPQVPKKKQHCKSLQKDAISRSLVEDDEITDDETLQKNLDELNLHQKRCLEITSNLAALGIQIKPSNAYTALKGIKFIDLAQDIDFGIHKRAFLRQIREWLDERRDFLLQYGQATSDYAQPELNRKITAYAQAEQIAEANPLFNFLKIIVSDVKEYPQFFTPASIIENSYYCYQLYEMFNNSPTVFPNDTYPEQQFLFEFLKPGITLDTLLSLTINLTNIQSLVFFLQDKDFSSKKVFHLILGFFNQDYRYLKLNKLFRQSRLSLEVGRLLLKPIIESEVYNSVQKKSKEIDFPLLNYLLNADVETSSQLMFLLRRLNDNLSDPFIKLILFRIVCLTTPGSFSIEHPFVIVRNMHSWEWIFEALGNIPPEKLEALKVVSKSATESELSELLQKVCVEHSHLTSQLVQLLNEQSSNASATNTPDGTPKDMINQLLQGHESQSDPVEKEGLGCKLQDGFKPDKYVFHPSQNRSSDLELNKSALELSTTLGATANQEGSFEPPQFRIF